MQDDIAINKSGLVNKVCVGRARLIDLLSALIANGAKRIAVIETSVNVFNVQFNDTKKLHETAERFVQQNKEAP